MIHRAEKFMVILALLAAGSPYHRAIVTLVTLLGGVIISIYPVIQYSQDIQSFQHFQEVVFGGHRPNFW